MSYLLIYSINLSSLKVILLVITIVYLYQLSIFIWALILLSLHFEVPLYFEIHQTIGLRFGLGFMLWIDIYTYSFSFLFMFSLIFYGLIPLLHTKIPIEHMMVTNIMWLLTPSLMQSIVNPWIFLYWQFSTIFFHLISISSTSNPTIRAIPTSIVMPHVNLTSLIPAFMNFL